jgi:hypothetical protein
MIEKECSLEVALVSYSCSPSGALQVFLLSNLMVPNPINSAFAEAALMLIGMRTDCEFVWAFPDLESTSVDKE